MFSRNAYRAINKIIESRRIIISAGAGMSVDSGLPDYRGNEGFWKSYPPLAEAGLTYMDVANMEFMEKTPAVAWGFAEHCRTLYLNTQPHDGYRIVKDLAKEQVA